MILNHYNILVNLEIVKFDNIIAVYLKVVGWYFLLYEIRYLSGFHLLDVAVWLYCCFFIKVHILSSFWSIIKLFSWNVSFNLFSVAFKLLTVVTRFYCSICINSEIFVFSFNNGSIKLLRKIQNPSSFVKSSFCWQ